MTLAGLLTFTSPWLLLALLGLPVVWWLLRLLPPTPKKVPFPPISLLLRLKKPEQTPARTPWWLLLLRLVIMGLLIIGLAEPVLNATHLLGKQGALVIVVDNGWPSAQSWRERQKLLSDLVEEADRNGKLAALVTTADERALPSGTATFQPARDLRKRLSAVRPRAWLPARPDAVAALAGLQKELQERRLSADVVWLSDGLAYDGDAAFRKALRDLGPVRLALPDGAHAALALLPPKLVEGGLEVTALRASAGDGKLPSRTVGLRALSGTGQLLGHGDLVFKDGAERGKAVIEIPFELRNQVARIDVKGVESAGTVALLDSRWKRRRVGIVTGGQEDVQPLLSDSYYISQALSPYAELVHGSISELLDQKISTLILPDVGNLIGPDHDKLEKWVRGGGTLVRFAGPRLAQNHDDLIPVQLRNGARVLNGSLSWAEPQKIGPFDATSPFAGLTIPNDVTINREVLAQPSVTLGQKTWARLEDGTPLVTGDSLGAGRRILFHITATPNWSNLPLSGLFVGMLERIVSQSLTGDAIHVDGKAPVAGSSAAQAGNALTSAQALKALSVLDGFGILGLPEGVTETVTPAQATDFHPKPGLPPGYYGTVSFDAGSPRLALNAVASDFSMSGLKVESGDAGRLAYDAGQAVNLKPYLLALAFALLLIDGLCALALSGRLSPVRVRRELAAGAAALVVGAAVLAPHPARAQPDGAPPASQAQSAADAFALKATLETPLAYVITHDPKVDAMSRAGLRGLARILRERTAMEPPEEPMAVDVARDELAFFPLLYWPVTKSQQDLDDATRAKVDTFMKNGGTIFFDTQDYQSAVSLNTVAASKTPLSRLLNGLDIPTLEPVPEDHVLTKSFYLLQDFPGRWSGGRVWVEAAAPRLEGQAPTFNDGVSSIIVGSNDYAAAWAEDREGRPLAAVVPGGDRQRELARRFGVNVVIYVLTGNYKADQVHVPALLERLGQ